MSPDRTEYTIDEVALMKANIDPDTCGHSVLLAEDLGIPGWELASAYRQKLVRDGANEKIRYRIVRDDETVSDTECVLIPAEDAERWQPEALPIQTANSEPMPVEPKATKDKRSTLLAVALLARHTGLYQKYNEQGRKGGQKAIAQLIRDTAEEHGYSLQGLSLPTLQKLLKDADDALKEQ